MTRVALVLFACLAACTKTSPEPVPIPSLQDAQLLGTTTGDFDSNDTAVFDDGSYVVVGSFAGEAVFDRGSANETTLEASGPLDGYVARYESDGRLRWVQSISGPGQQFARAVTAMPDGSCAVAGSGWAEAEFEDGTTLRNTDGHRGFVARFAGDGTIDWVRGFGDSSSALDVNAVQSFEDGGVLVAGYFWRRARFGGGEANETELTHDFERDFPDFVARFASDGSLVFAWLMTDGNINSLATLPDGSFFVTGGIRSTAVFAPGQTEEFAPPHGGNDAVDAFVARCDANGAVEWIHTAHPSAQWNSAAGWSVFAMADGGCALVGRYTSTLTLDEGGPDETTLEGDEQLSTYVARYTPSGSLRWARQMGTGFARNAPLGTTQSGDDVLLVAFTGETSSADQYVRNPALTRLDAGGRIDWTRDDFDVVRFGGLAANKEGTITMVGTIQAPALIAGAEVSPIGDDPDRVETVIVRLR